MYYFLLFLHRTFSFFCLFNKTNFHIPIYTTEDNKQHSMTAYLNDHIVKTKEKQTRGVVIMDASWLPLWERCPPPDLDWIYTISNQHQKVFPPREHVFRVYNMPVSSIRLVLLGQDPYIREGQAMGLSFSVPPDQKIPPSLKNIYQQIQYELYTLSSSSLVKDDDKNNTNNNNKKLDTSCGGDLSSWAEREGVFLLNTALTVLEGESGSHMSIWSNFIDETIRYISERNPNTFFLLLGKPAEQKKKYIVGGGGTDRIICGGHPSPLAAHRAGGFLGSDVFRRLKAAMETAGVQPICWDHHLTDPTDS